MSITFIISETNKKAGVHKLVPPAFGNQTQFNSQISTVTRDNDELPRAVPTAREISLPRRALVLQERDRLFDLLPFLFSFFSFLFVLLWHLPSEFATGSNDNLAFARDRCLLLFYCLL